MTCVPGLRHVERIGWNPKPLPGRTVRLRLVSGCVRIRSPAGHGSARTCTPSTSGQPGYCSTRMWSIRATGCVSGTSSASRNQSSSPQPLTHDVGERISWTLRPPISNKLENWEKRRAAMQQVCGNCHGPGFVGNFYHQFDSLVELYNDKFARPATDIMAQLQAAGAITPMPFDDKIEWTYYYLWHHEGRRARHGASMSGPDYAWWHGLFEVADRFYNEFLPEAEHLKPGISRPVLDSEPHRWRKGVSKEEIGRIIEFYRSRYGQDTTGIPRE